MPKVLVSDQLSSAAIQVFRDRGIEVEMRTGLDPAVLEKIIGNYDGLAVRSTTKITSNILYAAKKLKIIGRAGIGVDNIDVSTATSCGIVVMNTPFGNAITTAEHTIALMLSLARDIPSANYSTKNSKWEKSKFIGVELYGKTLGIIGCGNIGTVVADRALGLKMKVIAYDPFLSRERAGTIGIEKVEKDFLFARSDFITLHTPLTESTRYSIDAAAFCKMKRGVRIINCARGGLIIERDLLDALQSGTVAGAALDVFEREPATNNPLFGHEKIVCTPHLGASTTEAQENVALQVAEQMSDYLTQGTVTNALNMPSVLAEDAPRLRPYMKLAEQLGLLAGQLLCTGLTAVRVTFAGAVAHLNTKPLTQIVLQGVLSPTMESVNMVNAPVIARDRNIAVTESRRETCSGYHTLMQLTVFTEHGTCGVAGTLIHDNRPRLVAVNDIPVEAELGTHMLYVANEDKPGFIGRLGTALGKASINIATFHLGRTAPGREAIALIQVDQAVNGPLLDTVRALPHVVQAVALRF